MLRYDLHSHTTCSDGTLTPQELVFRAENKCLDLLAITDHDCVDAIEPAQDFIKAEGLKVELLAGVEISTRWQGFEIHIVGLGIDIKNQKLTEFLASQKLKRIDRAKKIGEKLAKKGYPEIYPLAQGLAKGSIISRSHFAKALIQTGVVGNFEQAFKKYLGKGKGAYAAADWPSIDEAVNLIKQAGGLSVMAHPARYDLSNKWLRNLIDEFASVGGTALEIGLSQVNPEQKRFIASLAKEHELHSSLGSDFHSPTRWCELGRGISLTDLCTPIWEHPKWPLKELDKV